MNIPNILQVFQTGVSFILEMTKHGLIHGDIKPSNFQIILDRENNMKKLKFIDFGGIQQLIIPSRIHTGIFPQSFS